MERPAEGTEGAQSLDEAFASHATTLLRLCVLLTGRRDAAEDLVQETFERAAPALGRLERDAVRPYLRATALNLWRNRLRRAAIEARHLWSPSRADELTFEEKDALWRAVRRLPSRQRACVVLRYYEEMSEAETATVLGCSVGTVKSQTSRAIARLGKELRDADRG